MNMDNEIDIIEVPRQPEVLGELKPWHKLGHIYVRIAVNFINFGICFLVGGIVYGFSPFFSPILVAGYCFLLVFLSGFVILPLGLITFWVLNRCL